MLLCCYFIHIEVRYNNPKSKIQKFYLTGQKCVNNSPTAGVVRYHFSLPPVLKEGKMIQWGNCLNRGDGIKYQIYSKEFNAEDV